MTSSTETFTRSKRARILGAIAIFLALSGLILLSGIILEPVRFEIQRRIEKALPDREVRLGKLSTNFVNTVSLSKIEISNPGGFGYGVFLNAARVRVSYNLKDILRMRWRLGESLATIEIFEPVLSLSRTGSTWNIPKIKRTGAGIPPLTVLLREGKVSVQDDTGALDGLEAAPVSGKLNLNPLSPSMEIEITTPENEKVTFKGDLDAARFFRISFEGKDLRPGSVLERFRLVPGSATISGGLDATFEVSGRLDLSIQSVRPWQKVLIHRFSGHASAKELTATVPIRGSSPSFRVNGTIMFSNEKIESESLMVESSSSRIVLSGTVLSPLINPSAQALVTGTLELGEIGSLMPGKAAGLGGSAQVHLDYSGTLADPEIHCTIKVPQAALARLPLSADAEILVSSHVLTVRNLSGIWGDGKIRAGGTFSEKKFSWNARLTGLPLNQIGIRRDSEGFALRRAGGVAAIRITGTGSRQDPKARGTIRVRDFTWGDSRPAQISGSVRYRGKVLRANVSSTDKKSSFAFRLSSKKSDLRLELCRLSLAGGERLDIKGRILRPSGRIIGSVRAGSISIWRIAPLVRTMSHFSGRISLKGAISGTAGDPLLKGWITGQNLSLENPEKRGIGRLSTEIVWSKRAFELPKIALARSYSGSFVYLRKEKEFTVRSTVKNGDPGVLLALMNAPTGISGSLNGTIDLTHKSDPDLAQAEPEWQGRGDLRLMNGTWGKTEFKKIEVAYRFEKENLHLEKLRVIQKEGSLSVTARTVQRQKSNPLAATASFKNFMIGDSRLDGDFRLEGNYLIHPTDRLSGNVRSENFTVNRFGAGDLSGTVEIKSRILVLSDLAWGDFFRGGGTILFGQRGSPKIEGNWISTPISAEEWVKILQLKDLPVEGHMSLSGSVSGTVSDMEYNLLPEFKDLRVRPRGDNGRFEKAPEGFSGKGEAFISKGIIKSLRARLRVEDEGKLDVIGQINLKTRQLSLECGIERLNSDILFNPMGWNLLKGTLGGRLSIGGDWKSPVARGEITGTGGSLGNIELDSWKMTGIFQEREFLFSRIDVRGKRRSWRFSVLDGSWIRPGKKGGSAAFNLVTDFANISLGPVFFVGRGTLAGRWKKKPGSDTPVFQAVARVSECTANNSEIKPFQVHAQYHDRRLRFLPLKDARNTEMSGRDLPQKDWARGDVDFSKLPCVLFKKLILSNSEIEVFSMDGKWCPEQPSFVMKGDGVDASLVFGILESPIEFSGDTSFTIKGLTKKGRPVIEGDLSLHKGKAHEVPVDELFTKFRWNEGILDLSEIRAKSEEYFTITASGRFPVRWGTIYPEKPTIDFKASCPRADLAFLNLLEIPQIKNAEGTFDGTIAVEGPASDPILSGAIRIRDGGAGSRYLMRRLSDLETKIRIESNTFRIQEFKCRIGKGRLRLSGSMDTLIDGGELLARNFDLTLETVGKRGVPIQVPELPAVKKKLGIPSAPSKGRPRFSVALTGTREKPKMSGWIEIADSLFSYPPPERERGDHPWLDRMEWDIELRAGKKAHYQNDFAYAEIDGSLRIKGNQDNLIVNGRLTSSEGTITLYGTKFELREAALEIVQPPAFRLAGGTAPVTEPLNTVYLQFVAEHETLIPSEQGGRQTDTVTLQLERTPLTGEFDSKKVKFRSAQNPDLESERVAARTGLGVSLEGLTPEERDLEMRKGIALLLDSQLASPLARALLQRTGLVDKIEITQDAEAGRSAELRGETPSVIDPLIGQSILLEKTFGSRLGIGYKATFDKIQDKADMVHQIQLRYPFFKGIWLYGSTELDTKENLGREPERRGGIQTQIKFDPADWFKKKDKSTDN